MLDGSISYGRQTIDEDDLRAVCEVLRGERLTQGPAVRRFEEALEQRTGASHAVAVANGTLALELAYAALGLGPGARLLTSANTFLASATAALRVGADAGFVDVDPLTGLLSVDEVASRLERGERIDAVTVVHFAGRVAPMGRWIELKRRFGFKLIEDACHSLGAKFRFEEEWWGPGAHPEVDCAALSFHPVKQITTAEGGAVLTAHASLARRVATIACHGIDREAGERPFEGSHDDGAPSWFAPMLRLGTNARLSDMHAALGVSQLEKLDRFLERRREIAAVYHEALSADWQLMDSGDEDHQHAWHLVCLQVEPERRPALWRHLEDNGIQPQLHYYPVPLQPYFRERVGSRRFPNAERHARSSLSLPIYPTLTDLALDRVLLVLDEFRRRST